MLAHRLGFDGRDPRGLGLFEVLQPQLQLVNLGIQLLGRAAKTRAPEHGKLQLQMLDLDGGSRQCGIALRQEPTQGRDLFGGIRMRAFHEHAGYLS